MSNLTDEDKQFIDSTVGINPSQESEIKVSESDTQKVLAIYKQELEKYYKGQEIKTPKTGQYYDYDYRILANNILIRHLEVKVRRNQFHDFPTTMIPLRKHAVALYYYNKLKIKTNFCAAYGCGTVAVLDLTKEPDYVEDHISRYDRGDGRGFETLKRRPDQT